jgi:hypothetical protein
MTLQFQQTINLARSLSFTEQLKLLKTLSTIVQQTHSLENQVTPEADTEFSAESFRTSWQQAVTAQTLPLSELWEGIDVD